ncbi:MAG: hypothetical protein K6T73_01145 [Candidatus Bathyarchaeota archaeon]|nr:hypothetical protein [Candidatus Bathyarchaeota archaeon]
MGSGRRWGLCRHKGTFDIGDSCKTSGTGGETDGSYYAADCCGSCDAYSCIPAYKSGKTKHTMASNIFNWRDHRIFPNKEVVMLVLRVPSVSGGYRGGVLKAIEMYGGGETDVEIEGFGIHFYPIEGYGLKIGKTLKKVAKIALPVAAGAAAMMIPGVGPAVAGAVGTAAKAVGGVVSGVVGAVSKPSQPPVQDVTTVEVPSEQTTQPSVFQTAGTVIGEAVKVAAPIVAARLSQPVPSTVTTSPIREPQPTLQPMPEYLPTSTTPYVPGTYTVRQPAAGEEVAEAPPLIPKLDIPSKYLLYGGIGLLALILLTRR